MIPSKLILCHRPYFPKWQHAINTQKYVDTNSPQTGRIIFEVGWLSKIAALWNVDTFNVGSLTQVLDDVLRRQDSQAQLKPKRLCLSVVTETLDKSDTFRNPMSGCKGKFSSGHSNY